MAYNPETFLAIARTKGIEAARAYKASSSAPARTSSQQIVQQSISSALSKTTGRTGSPSVPAPISVPAPTPPAPIAPKVTGGRGQDPRLFGINQNLNTAPIPSAILRSPANEGQQAVAPSPVEPSPVERLFPFNSRLVPTPPPDPKVTGGRGQDPRLFGINQNLNTAAQTLAASSAPVTGGRGGDPTNLGLNQTLSSTPGELSLGNQTFSDHMTDLATKALGGDEASEFRFQERLRFVNLGFGGSQATHSAAVVNLALNLSRGNFPDIISDSTVRELPWQDLGFNAYQEYLEWLGYEDLGNGKWRLLTVAEREDLGLGPAGGGSAGESDSRGTGSSRAPGDAVSGRGSFVGLTNWRI